MCKYLVRRWFDSGMRNLAVAAMSLLAVPTVASSNGLSPPTGPAASSTGTYTIQYQYTAETYVCTPTYLSVC